ncbi:hypothetical protein KPL35_17545 [Clostridium sp. CF011]|uniref:hypothetical protein n=1 Tax=Clostridium sp. CF011 TaxID=2843318 RepID=UPI001C0C3836|nr:hypothetical protein [Clostridium sp. CF011]MBU3093839.1 hypothetical protein [Clostridium sp. CF011]WAG71760.1 hypothetical protein LL036_18870 [Clostridium sp. CF011]
MKKNKLFALINFLSIVITFFIGFEVIKLKNNLINYIILAIINGCLMYLCQKLLDNKN